MTTYHAITTCHAEQWAAYGRAMVTTFERHWPADVSLTVYPEGFEGDRNGRVHFVDLDAEAPWLKPWKVARTEEQRGMRPEGYRYRWDAVKFSHKVAAIGAAAEIEADALIWLDADIVTHAPVTIEWLDGLFPASADMAWLDRERWYPECGFMMFRLPAMAPIIRQIVTAYQTGDIFKLQQWHDSYVIETVVTAAEAMGKIKVASLSGEGRKHHHPLCAGPMGAKFDHLKGKRKDLGRSEEFVGRRKEAYWR